MSQPTPSGPPVAADESADVIVGGLTPTEDALPGKPVMKFPAQGMASPGETRGGRVDHRLIAALAKPAPAA